MSKYTLELRNVLEREPVLFDFPYEFYDEEKRHDFEKNFIHHFFFREICVDSIARFKHYLEDKMVNVFPYYNELFKAADIEYSILDNYKMSEKTTVTRENEGKTAGFASAVGKVNDSENSTARGTGSDTTSATGNSMSHKGGTVTETGNATETDTQSQTENGAVEKKHLDTPNGKVDFSDPKYLSNISKDESNLTREGNGTKENETEKTTAYNTTDTTDTTSETESTTESETETNRTAEQKTTTDANNREYMHGSMTEIMEHTRVGNIGIDTDSDMIHKHIKLQKILSQIERMFFDECEDLFMQVW